MWVSLDAFTDDAGALGVPSHRTGRWFHQKVKNLHIWSNNETIVHRSGELVDEGNIEFWPQGYNKSGGLGLPNSNNGAYDFDDQRPFDLRRQAGDDFLVIVGINAAIVNEGKAALADRFLPGHFLINESVMFLFHDVL